MKQKLIVAALAAMSSLAANAGTVIIDDFNTPALPSFQQVKPDGTTTSTANGRTISIEEVSGVIPGVLSGSATVVNGGFSVSNDDGVDTSVSLKWELAAGLVPSGATGLNFLFTVVQSDGNLTDLAFSFNNSPLKDFGIPGNTVGQNLTFDIAADALDTGGTLELAINGDPGWDLRLDSIGLTYTDPDVTPPLNPIPEPATLALVGLGLLGAGALRRRR
ncbi:MAG: PEP-CTERM sorting domain-containing protein [Rhodocyclaceae bacterium]|nr:PEP-CTERM sorting domain-containing protein [Rhodocyclaceae bacterium]